MTGLLCLPDRSLAQGTVPAPVAPTMVTPASPPNAADDPLGRTTPAGMVAGFLAAVEEENYERAAQYFDLTKEPDAWGPSLARQLQRVLDRAGRVHSRLRLSSDANGHQSDGLMPEQERFGVVRTPGGDVDLVAERLTTKAGKVWLVSARTVAQLPYLSRAVADSLLDRYLPDRLKAPLVWGAPIGHWLALAAIATLAYAATWLVTKILWFAFVRASRRREDSQFRRSVRASALPFRVFVAVVLAWIAANIAGISIVARQRFGVGAEVLSWIALAWILWRVVDAVASYSEERMTLRGHSSMIAGITFMRRSVKVALLAIAIMATLDAIGFNVSTGLAALGIGGIAIALGAQKTIENFVGSLTLVADQPVRVGDFCKFGETLGTVEDIGMRSTRVRTLERTLVTVPNGQFSSMQIENYTRRDRFWFHPILELRYETTPDQMRDLLHGLRGILDEHERVVAKPARVRLIGLGENALNVEVFAYIGARDYDHFLEVQEQLTLKIMDLVEEIGTSFAFGSQTIYVARDRGVASRPHAPSQPFGRVKLSSARS